MGGAPPLLHVRERSGIMACRGAAGGTLDRMIKDIIIHMSAGPHAQLPDTDSQDHNPNTGNSPGRRYPAPCPSSPPTRPPPNASSSSSPPTSGTLTPARPTPPPSTALAHELIEARDDKRLRRLQKQLTKNLIECIGRFCSRCRTQPTCSMSHFPSVRFSAILSEKAN